MIRSPSDFIHSDDKGKAVSPLWQRYYLVGIALVLGTVFSLLLFQAIVKSNMTEIRREFRKHVFQQYLLINKDVQSFHQFISDAQSFFAASEEVTQDEFVYFFRTAIESQNKFLLFAWFPTKEMSSLREEKPFFIHHDVITEVRARTVINHPAVKDTIVNADPSLVTTTSKAFPVSLKEGGRDVPIIAMVAPTYDYLRDHSQTEEGDPSGYILALVRVRPFVHQLDISENGVFNYIYVFLSNPGEAPASLIYKKEGTPDLPPDSWTNIKSLTERYSVAEMIEIPLGSRRLHFLFTPTPDVIDRAANWTAWLVLLLGLFLTGLLVIFLKVFLKRNIQIRMLVEKRTRELEESEARQRAILVNIADGVLTMDNAGIIHMFNPAAEQMFGYSASEVTGENIKMLIPEPYWGDLEQLSMGDRGIVKERTGISKGQREFPMEISFGGMAGGQEHQYVAVMRDISERKQAEEALLQSNRALDDFVYIVSHDLKEPLRSIQNFSAILEEDCQNDLDEDCLAHLSTIKRVAKRMQDQLDSLLVYSRASHKEITFEVIDIKTLVNDIVDSLNALIEETDAEIVVNDPLPPIFGDRASLVEVFTNLIQNAIKYRRQGVKPLVEVGSLAKTGSEGTTPILFVKDNGIGIKAEHQETIFKMFKRLHTRDAYGGGTGSGLAIVKKLIERPGGKIWVESEMGKGATFYFTMGDYAGQGEVNR